MGPADVQAVVIYYRPTATIVRERTRWLESAGKVTMNKNGIGFTKVPLEISKAMEGPS